jgi:hypothetical protein
MKRYAISFGTRRINVYAENQTEARKKAVALFGRSSKISVVCID